MGKEIEISQVKERRYLAVEYKGILTKKIHIVEPAAHYKIKKTVGLILTEMHVM